MINQLVVSFPYRNFWQKEAAKLDLHTDIIESMFESQKEETNRKKCKFISLSQFPHELEETWELGRWLL